MPTLAINDENKVWKWIENETTKKINARWRPIELSQLADAMMMEESMQENREMEEGPVVKEGLGHNQGRP